MIKRKENTMSQIHPTAIINDGAQIGANVNIGPYCIIGEKVKLGDGVKLHAHVVIDGNTHIGDGTEVYPFASLGKAPQDLKYKGEDSRLRIGKNNIIREHVTMNTGTADDRMETTIGDNCLFMVGSHVAHDCIIGNNVILANNATLAGHVKLGNRVIIGGLSAVRQFIRIGDYSMIGGMSGVEHDVVPYSLVMGERAKLAGLNLVGLERNGFDRAQIKDLMNAFKTIFSDEGTISERLEQAANDYKDNDLVQSFIEFAQVKSKFGLCQPK